MTKPELTVLVLAGGDLQSKRIGPAPAQHDHPLLLPAGSGLAIDVIRSFYEKSTHRIEIRALVDQPPPTEVPIRYREAIKIQVIPPQTSILGTLKVGLASVKSPWVLINPITTLPSHHPELVSQIQVGNEPLIRENWSAMRRASNGSWLFEHKVDPRNLAASLPFTGILTGRTKQIINMVDDLPATATHDLLYLAESLKRHANAAVVQDVWHDLGHSATHAASRRSRLPSRAFNQLRHCQRRDVIVKQSSDLGRLTAEREYLEALPEPLQRYFPTVLSGGSGEEQCLVMEAVPFPSLAELHLHWDLGPNAWMAILERLSAIQADFGNAAPSQVGSSHWLYSDKLRTRWQQFTAKHKNRGEDPPWWRQELCINGRWFPSLERQVHQLQAALSPLETNSRLQLIHGDFCFNNILCDPLYRAIRLIDPRGEQAPSHSLPLGYGDNRYDLVKLFHSIGGHYDAIVNNLFRLRRFDSNKLDIDVYIPDHQTFLSTAYQEHVITTGLSCYELKILTASLFFSMLPLHGEDSKRQIALAFSGMLMADSAETKCFY